MENRELEAIVAATLAAGSLSATGNHAPKQVVERYRVILKELRDTGGAVPVEKPPPVKISDEALERLGTLRK